MKPAFGILPFLLLLSVAAFAQHIKLGVKAGINHSNLKVLGDLQDAKRGFNAGVFANLPLACRFKLQPELAFSQQGGNYSGAFEDKLNYLNIPVLAQYMITRKFKVQSGPQVGVLLSYKRKVLDPRILVVEADFARLDWSWAFGAAYDIRSGWGLDMRYNHGLNDISNVVMPNMPTKNRVWQVGLTYGCAGKH
jgi:hypothetical protein